MDVSIEYIFPDLHFKHLPAFAAYIQTHRMKEYVAYQVKLAKQLNPPILQYFTWMTDEEMAEITTIEIKGLFDSLINNNAKEFIKANIERWLGNQLPVVGKNNIDTADVAIILYMRKKTFTHFIKDYTTDIDTAVELVEEIDKFVVEQESIAFKTYISLLNQKINEQLHFIESITETSPGIIYVFDVVEQREIYSNHKLKELLGYSEEELNAPQGGLLKKLIHPDDFEATGKYIKASKDLKDGEIRTFKYRAKHKDGTYKWMRNYESVFKRTPEGKPWQMIGIALNVDKEKKATEQLQQREEQLLEAQEMALLGSFTWTVDKDEATTTPQLLKILSLKKHEPFKAFLSNVHPLDKVRVAAIFDDSLKEKRSYEVEFRYVVNEEEKVIWSKGKVEETADASTIVKGTFMDVTDHHRLLQKIQQSEKLYKQAEALTHIGNWKWIAKDDVMEWSDELYRIYGLEPQSEKITFEKAISFIHPEDKQVVVDMASRAFQTKEGYSIFYKILLPGGVIKYIHAKAEVVENDKGEVEFTFGTGQDITEQYTTKMLLEENQKYLEKITDAAPSIMIAYNVQTHQYNFVSKAVENVIGYNQEEVLKKGTSLFRSLIHPDDIAMVADKNNAAIALANQNETLDKKDIIAEYSYRIKHKNGNYKWVQTYGTILDRDAIGKVQHMLHISIDITEKVNAEQKIKEQEHLIKHIADASPTILYVYDLEDKKVIYINQEVTSVLEYSPTEVLAMGSDFFQTIFHEGDFDKMRQEHQKLVDNEQLNGVEFEIRMKSKRNDYHHILLKEIVFNRDEKTGKITQVLCAALDISDRKEMETALFQKTIELQQSNKNLEEFAYVASHDLKEPLRKISAFGERLASTQEEKLDPNGKFFLNKIIDSSKRMNTMIDDLLSLSMISTKKEFEHYSLQTVLDEVLQTLEFKIEKRKAIIESGLLPVAYIVPSQFRQLFQNLISNALKFVEDEVQPVIKISCKILNRKQVEKLNVSKATKYLQIDFKDNGIGFEQAFAEKIFIVFQRLHGRSEYEGTGIGLAICKKIIENHGGVIYATGEPGNGSTFTIVIPYEL